MMLDWQKPETALMLHMQLRELANTIPETRDSADWHPWLGRLHAIAEAIGNVVDSVALQASTKNIDFGFNVDEERKQIEAVLFRALAKTEIYAPATKGSFIPVGQSVDAYAALAKILGKAEADVLIIDPYMDHSIVTDFAPLINEGVMIRLLTDEQSVRASFAPALAKWTEQYRDKKQLSARLAPSRSLHDRVIITDYTETWSLTQSFKDFARRSPATISKIEGDASSMKRSAYEDIWNKATPI